MILKKIEKNNENNKINTSSLKKRRYIYPFKAAILCDNNSQNKL